MYIDATEEIPMPLVRMPCYCATLRQAARALTALYDERIKSSGIRATQFTILQALTFKPGARITDMEQWLAIDQTTLTRNLALLERRRLIEVIERPTGREKCWGLTRAGRAKFTEAKSLWEAAQAEVEQRFGAQRTRDTHQQTFELAANLSG
jgi:DNA-binding MarR family transcriptional regulator